ncbi:MAG: hypothetical protein IKU70_12175 [Clostridia bacterium]|nr:hypothetical protein [Clostridia bacterium]
MKLKNHKKGLTIAVLVALLLTFTVSGTIAFLTDKTNPVQNVFTPTKVDTEIAETIVDDAKTSITVYNKLTADGCVDAYVRVAVVGNWCDDNGKIVKPWALSKDDINQAAWTKIGDYYYYNSILPAGTGDEFIYTENLLANGVTIAKSSSETGYENLHLVVTVMQQAVQAEGMLANSAQEAFGMLEKMND